MDCKVTMQILAARLSKEYIQCFTHLYENRKEAFIADVLNMMKIPEDTEHDNGNSNGNISHDTGVGHADDHKAKCLFGMSI